MSVPPNRKVLWLAPSVAAERSFSPGASAPITTLAIRQCVSVLPPNDGPGKLTFTTVPGGASTRIGRKQPEFFGMEKSVSCSTASYAALHAPPGVVLTGPFACGDEP